MILKQQVGSNLTLCLATLIIMSSCSSININSKYNYFNGSEFYNDSLSISGRFFGDIEYYVPNKREVNKTLKNIKYTSYKDLLVYGKANFSPKYEVFLFYKKNHKKDKMLNRTILLINDTINNIVFYKKRGVNKSVFVLLKSIDFHKSNKSILQDGKSIISSIKFDNSIKKELTYMKIFNSYRNEDNILYVMNKFDTAPIIKNPQNEWTKFQLLTTILSIDTEYYKYKKLIKKFEQGKKKVLSGIIEKATSKKTLNKSIINNYVIREISRLSEKKQIIMLNEMHWKPEHRILALKLLKPLKEKGYEYLAVEAIDKEKDSLLNIRKYPTQSTGYYTREPYFGLFIRKALDLGFKVVGYDDSNSDDRENTQARNIKSIFDKNPKAKVFVYAGIDHILEKSSDDSSKRMAEIFKKQTGIDPLTIDQVELVSNTKNELTLLNSKLFTKEKKVNSNVDYFVINNLKISLDEIDTNLETIPFFIKNQSLALHEGKEVFVSLYFINEYLKYKSNSIPVLNRIKSVVNNQIDIRLPKGKYYMSVKDINNYKLISKEIEIK